MKTLYPHAWFHDVLRDPNGVAMPAFCIREPIAARGVVRACRRFLQVTGRQPMATIEWTINHHNRRGGVFPGDASAALQFYADLLAKEGPELTRLVVKADHHPGPKYKDLPFELAYQYGLEDAIAAHMAQGIHLDFAIGGKGETITPDLTAFRQAEAYREIVRLAPDVPKFICSGYDVPTPGGHTGEDDVPITSIEAALETIEATERHMARVGLLDRWKHEGIVLVVNVGADFGPNGVISAYGRNEQRRKQVQDLIQEIWDRGYSVEKHSQDFQPTPSLKKEWEDKGRILKVGPEITHEQWLVYLSIDRILEECDVARPANLRQVVLHAMRNETKSWAEHYTGSDLEVLQLLLYSPANRVRYFMAHPAVVQAIQQTMENFRTTKVPAGLAAQYFPAFSEQFYARDVVDPEELVDAAIAKVVFRFLEGCGQGTL